MSTGPDSERPAQAAEDWGSYVADRARKLVVGAGATPEQRLAWLEEALLLALQSGALPRRRPDTW